MDTLRTLKINASMISRSNALQLAVMRDEHGCNMLKWRIFHHIIPMGYDLLLRGSNTGWRFLYSGKLEG
jgi:hypothetical protein